MDKVTTATGKEFDSGYLVTIPSPAMMYLRIHNSDFDTVSTVFRNPEETARLTYAGVDYEGYTKFVSIAIEGTVLKVGLEKVG